ncbi:hypothetical protein MRX96_013921 [Rhipicephalus microplus]
MNAMRRADKPTCQMGTLADASVRPALLLAKPRTLTRTDEKEEDDAEEEADDNRREEFTTLFAPLQAALAAITPEQAEERDGQEEARKA